MISGLSRTLPRLEMHHRGRGLSWPLDWISEDFAYGNRCLVTVFECSMRREGLGNFEREMNSYISTR
jgi:hypothetical protein